MTARDRLILIVVAGIAALGASWFLALSPRRQQASTLGAQVSSAQAQLNTLQSTLAQRQAVKSTFAQSYSQLTRLGEAVPAEADVPSLLYQIQTVAQATGVDFQSIHVTAAGGAAGASAPASSTPTSATAGAGSSPSGAAAASFATQSFSFSFAGNFFHLAAFFQRLEHAVTTNGSMLTVTGRLLTLNSINLTAGSTFPMINATVTATAYTLPAAQGLLAGATAAGPAPGTPVSAPSSPSVPTPSAVVVR